MYSPVILIPAYHPDESVLPDIVLRLLSYDPVLVIVVDDGNGPDFSPMFDMISQMPHTIVIHHDQNRGKGAALRSGFNYVLESRIQCSCVVTVDADGQHLPDDVAKVMDAHKKDPESVVLGVRQFSKEIPLRSLMGNKITCMVFRGFVGKAVSDTQTGLRAIPVSLLANAAELGADRYAYELEMLLEMVAHDIPVKEVPITTVYEDNNAISSFRPVMDSFLIYKTLVSWWFRCRLRQMILYSLAGIVSTVADFGCYILLIHFSCGVAISSILARIVSVVIHFSGNRYFTFGHRMRPNLPEIGRYLLVVLFNLSASIGLIHLLMNIFPIGEVGAKVAAQLILFLSTYALLNGFVFLRKK